MTKDKSNIEKEPQPIKLSSYLQYVGPFIIFLGITRLIIFYNAFGISIVNFLDFSEILTSFLDIIVLSIILTAYSILQSFITNNEENFIEMDKLRKLIFSESSLFKRFWLNIKLINEQIISGIILLLFYFILHFFYNEITYSIILRGVIFFTITICLLILISEINRIHHVTNSSVNYKKFISMVFYILIFVGLVVFFAQNQVTEIKENKSTFGVSITLDSEDTIISDSTNYYIGKTNNFLFFYHEKEKETDVFPMKEIKQITFKNKVVKFRLND